VNRLLGSLARRPRSPRTLLILAGILPLAAGGLLLPLISGPSSRCQQIALPAYFYPGADWTRAAHSRPVPSIMILDITSSGAGNSPDPNYQAAVRQAQAAGIKILGYANTDYTQRPAAAVETDVRNYAAWYNVTDFFLDEASSNSDSIGYYRRLTDYIRRVHPGAMVMLNPGIYPDRQYMSLGDVMLVYEDTYANYINLQVPGWAAKYPASRFAHVIYATPGSQLASVIRLSEGRHAGYVYVTDNAGSNPYGSLASYWPREDAMVAARCHGGSP
jgi:Spherulation-specific family 4